jgi:cytochrome c oxidase assembly factor CtaG
MNGRSSPRVKIVAFFVVTTLALLSLADVAQAAMAATGVAGCATLCAFDSGCSATSALPFTVPMVALTTITLTIGPTLASALPATMGDVAPPHRPLLSVAARSPPLA